MVRTFTIEAHITFEEVWESYEIEADSEEDAKRIAREKVDQDYHYANISDVIFDVDEWKDDPEDEEDWDDTPIGAPYHDDCGEE